MSFDPGDRIASVAQLHPLASALIIPRVFEAAFDGTILPPQALEGNPQDRTCESMVEICEKSPRLRPWDCHICFVSIVPCPVGAKTQKVKGFCGTFPASPLFGHEIEALASVEWKLVCLLKTVPFAERMGKPLQHE